MNREFLMLANDYNESKHQVAGRLMSEKLDGQRCWWDGGFTRGWKKKDVPWANNDKDDRYREEQISTGMWSRYGNVIHAPGWYLDKIPQISLDGELWIGRGQKQLLDKTIKGLNPGENWRYVKYMCFDNPPYASVLQDGRINNQNFKKTFQGIQIASPGVMRIIDVTYKHLRNILANGDLIQCHEQIQLSYKQDEAKIQLEEFLQEVLSKGGEGVMLRKGFWQPHRCDDLLKYKPFKDDEARVLDVNPGKDRLEGLMGSITVLWKGKVFDIGTGFSDEARILDYQGATITFRYNGLTDEGIPKEARFLRMRDES